MSDKETLVCWACNDVVLITADVCTNCGMPLKDSNEEVEDIDSFLDDLETKSSEIDKAGINGAKTTEFREEMPDIPDFDIDPDIPEFTEEIPDIPDFATEILDDEDSQVTDHSTVDSIEEVTKSIPVEMEPSKPFKVDEKVIEEGLSDLPTHDDAVITATDEKEKIISEIVELITLSSLTLKQKLRIFLPQLTYWSIVFIIISFASLSITNSNFTLEVFNSDEYEISAELFLFGWISFIPMGWFYRYKLNQYRVKDSIMYGLSYIILQLLYLGIITIIFFLLVNPNAQLNTITETDTAVNTIMSTYVYFSFLGFLISGLTLGFVLFFVGYRFYFNQIYEITPTSKLSN